MLPTKFQVNWPFCSGDEAKNIFAIGTVLTIFDLQVTPILPTKFRQLAFRFRKRNKTKFKMAAILDFRSKRV